jgi:hypothetical protein
LKIAWTLSVPPRPATPDMFTGCMSYVLCLYARIL